jgi:hypothetical protein
MDPVINGIRHKGGNRDHGHIIVPLPPR